MPQLLKAARGQKCAFRALSTCVRTAPDTTTTTMQTVKSSSFWRIGCGMLLCSLSVCCIARPKSHQGVHCHLCGSCSCRGRCGRAGRSCHAPQLAALGNAASLSGRTCVRLSARPVDRAGHRLQLDCVTAPAGLTPIPRQLSDAAACASRPLFWPCCNRPQSSFASSFRTPIYLPRPMTAMARSCGKP